jgi:DNA-binding NarL/FixJ family response regulator
MPNKEIAGRLYVSHRTVENQLHAAYEKLGVRGRGELGKALRSY